MMHPLQVLLRVGIVRSKRAPTKMHPYGYMKDKFVWSLVSAVGIFCLGAGVTCAHGFSNLFAPAHNLEHLGYGLAGVPLMLSMTYHVLTSMHASQNNIRTGCNVLHTADCNLQTTTVALHVCQPAAAVLER